jgi:hypothetical protein
MPTFSPYLYIVIVSALLTAAVVCHISHYFACFPRLTPRHGACSHHISEYPPNTNLMPYGYTIQLDYCFIFLNSELVGEGTYAVADYPLF